LNILLFLDYFLFFLDEKPYSKAETTLVFKHTF
jgi:hypothetical protein